MSRLFVLPHEAAVAVHVGAEYRGELPFQSSPWVHHPVRLQGLSNRMERA
jgi:hypothetical protein